MTTEIYFSDVAFSAMDWYSAVAMWFPSPIRNHIWSFQRTMRPHCVHYTISECIYEKIVNIYVCHLAIVCAHIGTVGYIHAHIYCQFDSMNFYDAMNNAIKTQKYFFFSSTQQMVTLYNSVECRMCCVMRREYFYFASQFSGSNAWVPLQNFSCLLLEFDEQFVCNICM